MEAINKGRLPVPLGTERNGFIKTPDGWKWKKTDIKPTEKFVLNDRGRRELEKLGVAVYGSRLPERIGFYEQHFKDFDFKQYFSQIKEIYKENKFKSISEDPIMSVTFEEDCIELLCSGKSPEGGYFYCKRKLEFKNNIKQVDHHMLEIPPSIRGKGIVKRVLKIGYEQYKKCGINLIHTTANMVSETPINGANVWGKYGFGIKSRADTIPFLRNLERGIGKSFSTGTLGDYEVTQKDYEEIKSLINSHYNTYKDDKPFPMIQIHERLGKKRAIACLQDAEWKAILDLNDVDSKTLFETQLSKNV